MLWCWQQDPKARPSFTDLRHVFESMLEKDSEGEYFNFNIDEKKDYYHVDEEAVEYIEETGTDNMQNYESEKTDLSLYEVPVVQAEFARPQKYKDDINDPTSFVEGTSHRNNVLAEISTKYRTTGLKSDDPSILKSNLNKANSGIENLTSRSNCSSHISVMADVHSEATGVVNTNHEDVTMEDDRIYRSEFYIETTGSGNSTLETVNDCQNPTLETVNEWQNKKSEIKCFSQVYTNKNSGIFYAKNEFEYKQDETVDENSRNQRAFDDVFTSCANCIPLPLTDGSSGHNSCQACGRTFTEMTTCKRIHTSDGNDSAFSSTSSECLSDYSQGPHSEHGNRRMGLDLAQLNEDARDYSAISSFLVVDSYLLKNEGILRKDTRKSHSYSQISLSDILPESASPPPQIIQKQLPYMFMSDAVSQELNETRVQKFYPLELLIAHKDITISSTRL
ncbi:hypothetical protein ACJMK2_036752 [Sinanodonta woodiana]|uniref:Uncharacterized protein n=1 Tax=Sinanodonta woodiana TaxID=1069815 RepID=A0ABD3WLQ7_SINWO